MEEGIINPSSETDSLYPKEDLRQIGHSQDFSWYQILYTFNIGLIAIQLPFWGYADVLPDLKVLGLFVLIPLALMQIWINLRRADISFRNDLFYLFFIPMPYVALSIIFLYFPIFWKFYVTFPILLLLLTMLHLKVMLSTKFNRSFRKTLALSFFLALIQNLFMITEVTTFLLSVLYLVLISFAMVVFDNRIYIYDNLDTLE